MPNKRPIQKACFFSLILLKRNKEIAILINVIKNRLKGGNPKEDAIPKDRQ